MSTFIKNSMPVKIKPKKKKVTKINNIRPPIIEKEQKPIDKDGYPIKRWEICFRCGNKFVLDFSFSRKDYSLKHFWYYWSGKEEDKQKFVDNFCLKNLYLDLKNRKNLSLKAKKHLSSYVSRSMLLN
jgi:hypothetical protein